MTLKYSSKTTVTEQATTELNALANDVAALGPEINNEDSANRNLLSDVIVEIGVQAARGGSLLLQLIIVPSVGGSYGDVSGVELAEAYVAKTLDGKDVEWNFASASTAAATLTASRISIPNAKFKYGLLNKTNVALAATGNTIEDTQYGYVDE